MKRKRPEARQTSTSTPEKTRSLATTADVELDDEIAVLPSVASTPSRSARKTKSILVNGSTPTPKANRKGAPNGNTTTPSSHRRVLFATPLKQHENGERLDDSPSVADKANRSAQRKSAARLIERAAAGGDSGEEGFSDEDELARQILGAEAVDSSDDAPPLEVDVVPDKGDQEEDAVVVTETPVKRGRGRPRKSEAEKVKKARKRSLTPPENLPPHERYFYDNRPGGGAKTTSNNTLATHELLNHDEYLEELASFTESHKLQIESLLQNHAYAFDQWIFELRNGFNICLYGYGSKRSIIDNFAQHLYDQLSEVASMAKKSSKKETTKPPNIFVINGYNTDITARDILTTLLTALVSPLTKLPLQPTALLSTLFSLLAESPTSHLYVLMNSVDAAPLRRHATQLLVSSLASHPQISIVATADTPSFPLLWNTAVHHRQTNQKGFQHPKWLYHDGTTFVPLTVEASGAGAFDAVETVNELLGRGGRRGVSGRDGVGFVLRSLPENARALYRMLLAEQLAAADLEGDVEVAGFGDNDDDEDDGRGLESGDSGGVEWSVLYCKAVEEFVCSNEMTFRTLLKEFYDHRMVESKRDALGSETLFAPFRREELESLLEELVGL